MSPVPLDVIRDCFDYLPYKDLLTCQRAHSDFDHLIQDSTELRLRIFLGEHGIRAEPPELFKNNPLGRQQELERLSEIERRLSLVQYGQLFPDTRPFQVSASNVNDIHLIAVADEDVFLPITELGEEGILGIARYRLTACAKPPDILNLRRVMRHYQVDSAEVVLLLIFREEE